VLGGLHDSSAIRDEVKLGRAMLSLNERSCSATSEGT
jgi:hypothetical protein